MRTEERDLQASTETRPLRFFVAFQESRAAFYAVAVASALAAAWLGVLQISRRSFIEIFSVAMVSVFVFLWLYRGRDEAGAARLAPWHVAFDLLLVSWGVEASGGIESPWWIWYLAICGGAAFLGERWLVIAASCASVLCYLGALIQVGDVRGFDHALALALGRLLFLFGSAFFLLRGVFKLRQSGVLVRRLQAAGQRRIDQLSSLTAELDQANERLRELSLTDPLTGLHNRRFVQEKIGEDVALVRRAYGSRRYGRPPDPLNIDLGFLLVDIDRFKEINDRHGHHTGDLAIRHVCDVLRSSLREQDTLARWGGEEFLVLVRQTNGSYLTMVAARLVQNVRSAPLRVEQGEVRLTCSVGWSYFPFGEQVLDSLDWNGVLRLADAGLYLAKQEGRDRAVGVLPGKRSLSAAELEPVTQDLAGAFAAGDLVPVRSVS